MKKRTVNKATYKVDLRALHAQCEANYARLLRLFPDYESCNSHAFAVNSAQVRMDVIERSRYTTLFRLQSFSQAAAEKIRPGERPWLPSLRLEVRAYHDAGMLEVVAFQSGGRTEGRYSYPNPSMHQQDEKVQQNAFLADWLAHCLRYGEADIDQYLKKSGKEPA